MPTQVEPRIDRNQLFMEMAELWSRRSTCLRGHTAAVIARPEGIEAGDPRIPLPEFLHSYRGLHVVGIGYNGAPPGLPHCTEVGCDVGPSPTELIKPGLVENFPLGAYAEAEQALRPQLQWETGCRRAVHAELNAIAHAARYGTPTQGCVMYTLSAPCLKCAQAIISAGIVEVRWKNEYRAQRLDLLAEAGVKVVQVVDRH
jgi:dCMP deaminase